jgi:hypothetical protein
VNRRYCFPLALLIPLSTSADKGEAPWKGPNKPVYVVTENHYVEGFTPVGHTPRIEDLIAIEIIRPKILPAGNSNYKAGAQITLFVAGQRQGNVTVKKVMPFQCDSSALLVTTDWSFSLRNGAMALATNAATVRSHETHQRQPNEAELDRAKLLAMNEFLKHGVLGKFSKNLKVEHAMVMRVDEAEGEFFVGTLSLEAEGADHEIFLVAKMASSGDTMELARYHKTTDIEDGKDAQYVRFVDQLDLDGDGTDEIVVEVMGYESEEFVVYKRAGGRWRKVHVGGRGGC